MREAAMLRLRGSEGAEARRIDNTDQAAVDLGVP